MEILVAVMNKKPETSGIQTKRRRQLKRLLKEQSRLMRAVKDIKRLDERLTQRIARED